MQNKVVGKIADKAEPKERSLPSLAACSTADPTFVCTTKEAAWICFFSALSPWWNSELVHIWRLLWVLGSQKHFLEKFSNEVCFLHLVTLNTQLPSSKVKKMDNVKDHPPESHVSLPPIREMSLDSWNFHSLTHQNEAQTRGFDGSIAKWCQTFPLPASW